MTHVHGDPSLECTTGDDCPFAGLRFVPPVSQACKGNMHPVCDWCGCSVCHRTCQRCRRNCRALYDGKDGLRVCSDCYLSDGPKTVTSTVSVCMQCGNQGAYRDPRSGDDRHLCGTCHRAAGHRWQENGEWQSPIDRCTYSDTCLVHPGDPTHGFKEN